MYRQLRDPVARGTQVDDGLTARSQVHNRLTIESLLVEAVHGQADDSSSRTLSVVRFARRWPGQLGSEPRMAASQMAVAAATQVAARKAMNPPSAT